MRFLATLMLAGALGAGAAGCKTVYEPIVVEAEVRAGVVVPPTPGPYDKQVAPKPLEGDPTRFVIYRQRTVIDWDRIGHVTCTVLEGTGHVLLFALEVTGRLAVECVAHAACR